MNREEYYQAGSGLTTTTRLASAAARRPVPSPRPAAAAGVGRPADEQGGRGIPGPDALLDVVELFDVLLVVKDGDARPGQPSATPGPGPARIVLHTRR